MYPWYSWHLRALLCLQLIHIVLSSSSSSSSCKGSYIQETESKCNPSLSDIGTAILASDGTDYSDVCSAFSRYVRCMEPDVEVCSPLRVRSYWNNKSTYSDSPYNCVPPYPTYHNISLLASYKQTMDNTPELENKDDGINSSARSSGSANVWLLVMTIVGVFVTKSLGSIDTWTYEEKQRT